MRKRKFLKLYKQLNEPIYRFIYFKVSSKEIAEDITSEVFLKSWQFAQKNKVQNPRALFYRIARNLVIDFYKKEKPLALESEHDIGKEDINLVDLEKALNKLTENEKDAFMLYCLEGFSHDEISQIINKKPSAVQNLVMRARKKIKKYM